MPINKEKKYFEDIGFTNTPFYPQSLYSNVWLFKSLNNYIKISDMLADNRDYLKSKLGKQHFVFQDSGCRNLYSWRIEFNNGTLWILTGREKGTCYEYNVSEIGSEKKLRKEIKKYLSKLFNV